MTIVLIGLRFVYIATLLLISIPPLEECSRVALLANIQKGDSVRRVRVRYGRLGINNEAQQRRDILWLEMFSLSSKALAAVKLV